MSENLKAAIVDGVRVLNLDFELKIYHFETGACSSGLSSMEQVHDLQYLQKSCDKVVNEMFVMLSDY